MVGAQQQKSVNGSFFVDYGVAYKSALTSWTITWDNKEKFMIKSNIQFS